MAAVALPAIVGFLAWRKGFCKTRNNGSNVDLSAHNVANVKHGGNAEETLKGEAGVQAAPYTGNQQERHLLEGGIAARPCHGNASLPGPITRDCTTGHQPEEAQQLMEPSDVRLDIEHQS